MKSPFLPRPLAFSLSRFSSAAAVCAVLTMATSAPGATFEWDSDTTTAGAAGGTGLWNTTNQFWWNGTANTSWSNVGNHTALFGGSPGTVSLDDPITAGGLTFAVDGYIIDSAGDFLTLAGATPTITVTTAGHVAEISAEIDGTAGLTKAGAGTLALTSFSNTFSGPINVVGGTLSFTNASQLGLTDQINLSNGSTLSYLNSTELTLGIGRQANVESINIGTGGATIHSTAAFRLFDDGQLTGSGLLTRKGDGTTYALDIRGNNSGFTGSVLVESGTLELQNSLALGDGTAPNQQITVNAGAIVSTTATTPQKVVLNGGTLAFNNNNTSSYTGPVIVQGNSSVLLGDFYNAGTGRSGAIRGPLTGSGTLTINGQSGNLQTLLLAGNATGFTGDYVVSSNGVLAGSVGVAGGTGTLGQNDVTMTGGVLRITPAIGSQPLAGQTAGLLGSYYNQGTAVHNNQTTQANYSQPDATRVDDDLHLRFLSVTGNLGTTEGVPTGIGTINGGNVEQFAALWQGLLKITEGGQYTFVSSSDDASVLFIDGVQVLTNEGGHDFPGGGARGLTVNLTPGEHSIAIKLTQGTGGAGIVLAYEGPDQPIPLQNPFPKDGYDVATLVPGSVLSNAVVAGSIANNITIPEFSSGGLDASGLQLTSTGTITIGDGGTLNFGSLTGHTVTQSGNILIAGDVTLGTQLGPELNRLGTATNATISGIISGTGGITKTGAGTLTLTGANTFTGPIGVAQGALIGNTISLSRDIALLDPTATVTFNQTVDGTYGATITGGGNIVKVGGGLLTFTRSVGGTLTANAGGVRLVAGSGGDVIVNTGATVTAEDDILGVLTVNGGTLTVPAAAGSVSAGGIVFEAGTVNLSLPGAPSATGILQSTAGLDVLGRTTLNLNAPGAVPAGTYRLLDYTGAPLSGAAFGSLKLGTAPTGSFYSLLVNNTAATSVDFLVESFGALNTWSGGASGVWDTATPANWSAGAFANGQQVTFNDSGANKTITGPAVAPQRITVTNTEGNDYSFANAINGSVAGGIQKSGAGTATFSGPVTMAGPINVTGGRLRLTNTSLATPNAIGGIVSVGTGTVVEAAFGGVRPAAPGESGSSALGGAPIALNGGELILAGNRYDAGPGGLTGQYYSQQVQRSARIQMASLSGINAMFNTSIPETLGAPNDGFTNAISNIDFPNAFGNNAPFASVGQTSVDNIMGLWKGRFVVPTETTYTFLGRSDDGMMVFINGELVLNRNNFQGNSLTSGTPITLPAGSHDIQVSFYEGGGGAGIQLFQGADGQVVTLSQLTAAQPVSNLGNNVTLNASSTLRATNTFGVNLGSLIASTPGTTLTTGATNALDGLVRFANTTFDANGTYTLQTHSDVALGAVSDGANGSVIVSKTGTGNLIFDEFTAPGDLSGTTIKIENGRVVAQRSNVGVNPLGTAKIELNGVGTAMQFSLVETGGGNASYDNAIAVNENARIEFFNRSTTTRETILGSAANGITIAPGKTLEFIAGSNVNPRINSPISGDGNVRVHMGADAGNNQGYMFLGGNNTFTGSFTIENGGQLRLDHANALKSVSVIDLHANARLEFYANDSFTSASPRILTQPGTFIRLHSQANPGQAVSSGTLEIGTARILEIQSGNALVGGGVIERAIGSYLRQNTGNNFLFGTTQVGVRPTDLRPLDVIQVNSTLNGAGDDIFEAGWGATPAGTIVQVWNGNRILANTNVQEMNGQLVINDASSRELLDGVRLDIGPLGGTFAATTGTTLTIREDLFMDSISGKVTIGAHIPLDSRFANGTVAFAHADIGEYIGTTASAQKAIDVIAGAALEGRADADGETGFGSAVTPTLGVNLARGTLRSLQSVTNQATPGIYSATVGAIFATGAGTVHVNRNSTNAGVVTDLRIDAPIVRSPGATLSLLSQNNDLGVSERIKFTTSSEAPGRLTLTGTTPGNMVAPYLINASGNIGSFVDYNPAQDAATGPGFVNATYTTVSDETGLTAGTIADVIGPVALTADHTVGAVRMNAAVSGAFTLTSQSGGFILTSPTNTNHTVSAKLAAPAGTEFIFFSGGGTGGIHTLSGTITSDSGFTKFGPRTVNLTADNSATLFGDIRVNEASLTVSNNNQLGAPANKVILNGGNLRVNQNQTIDREIIVNPGGGQLANDGNRLLSFPGPITGEGGLTVIPINGNNGTTQFTGANANTFAGGLIINGGAVEFSRNDQLGAVPSVGDYDRGHVVINEGGGTNATLRLADGAGTVSTGDRQFTLLGANARIEVPGVNDTLNIANDIRGSGGINKNGAGTLILSNPEGNGYTGPTLVNAGALLVNNTAFSGTGSGAVTVNSGAVFGGAAVIDGGITGNTGSTLSPGASLAAGSTGVLRGQNGLTLADDSNFHWSLGSLSTANPGVNFDRLTIDRGVLNVAAGSNFLFDFAAGTAPSANPFWSSNQTWENVIQLTSFGTPGTLGAFDIDNAAWAALGSFSAVPGADGYDLQWTVIPEPGTGLSLLAGLSSLLGMRRLRRRG